MSKATHSRRGFTLLEMMISVTVLSLAMGSVIILMKRGSAAWQANMALGTLDTKTERALDRIVRYLEPASGTNLQPDFSVTALSSWIDFQEITGYGSGAVLLSSTRQILLELIPGELDNGIDDNNNGMIDESRVVLIENLGQADERRVTIARGVREYLQGELPNGVDDNGNGLVDEPGLCFDMDGATLNVRVSFEKIGPTGQVLTRTLESSVTLQN